MGCRRILMIAYHYPPVGVSSGVHRTLKFSQYLPDYGWKPVVLSITPNAYGRVSDDQLGDIPSELFVKRACGFDTARALSLKGRYPHFLALPDRWVSWWPAAAFAGMRLIKKYKPDVIWSTYPIATAQLIGLTLHKMTGLPWVADLRDSMVDPYYPVNPAQRRVFRWLEQRTVLNAAKVVFTTPGTLNMYQERYPNVPDSRFEVIANGYDEVDFARAAIAADATPNNLEIGHLRRPLRFVHSGVLYPSERDPLPFFQALATLKGEGEISSQSLKVILRATGHDDVYLPLLCQLGIEDIVELAPALDYRLALAEMLACDGLLLFQAGSCDHQIPAKVYEYIRAGRPILALTTPEGDTAAVLAEAGVGQLVVIDDQESVRRGLLVFIRQVSTGEAVELPMGKVEHYSRYARTAEFASLLGSLACLR